MDVDFVASSPAVISANFPIFEVILILLPPVVGAKSSSLIFGFTVVFESSSSFTLFLSEINPWGTFPLTFACSSFTSLVSELILSGRFPGVWGLAIVGLAELVVVFVGGFVGWAGLDTAFSWVGLSSSFLSFLGSSFLTSSFLTGSSEVFFLSSAFFFLCSKYFVINLEKSLPEVAAL